MSEAVCNPSFYSLPSSHFLHLTPPPAPGSGKVPGSPYYIKAEKSINPKRTGFQKIQDLSLLLVLEEYVASLVINFEQGKFNNLQIR